jgi:hypothetical protein
MPGRGAWLHRDPSCLRGARGGLSRSFRGAVSDRDFASLRVAFATLTSRPTGATGTTDPARDLLGAPASDSGLLGRDAVDIATRGKAEE